MASELPIASDVVVRIGATGRHTHFFLRGTIPLPPFFCWTRPRTAPRLPGLLLAPRFSNSFSKARELLTEHGMKEEQIDFVTPDKVGLAPVPNPTSPRFRALSPSAQHVSKHFECCCTTEELSS